MTKNLKFKKNLFFCLSALCSFGPLIVYVIIGLIQGEWVGKFVLTMTAIASIGLAVFQTMQKLQLKSITYIVLIGLWVALDRVLTCIIIIAVCTILDELVFTPLYKRYKEDYHTNLQIDKREKAKEGGDNE